MYVPSRVSELSILDLPSMTLCTPRLIGSCHACNGTRHYLMHSLHTTLRPAETGLFLKCRLFVIIFFESVNDTRFFFEPDLATQAIARALLS